MALDPVKAMVYKGQELFDRIRKVEQLGGSEIQTLFKGSVIFITGGTGFVGKQLLEKLLRSCPGIEKVYLLMRAKKGRSVAERLELQWKDPVFAELWSIDPEFRRRVFAVQGDVGEVKLGMKKEDRSRLQNEVHFIFHTAATVRFDEPLKKAVLVNVRGTREMISFAKEATHLKAMVYMSTAYANCNQAEVKEVFYDTPIKPETLVEMAETMEETKLEALSKILTDGWPNTYTFSKALAENLVSTSGQYLPVCVVRPCIITPTFQEPTFGWLDISNVFGPSGSVLGAGVGILHMFYTRGSVRLDLVPLDFVNNLTIAAAWDTVRRHERNERDVRIYTCSRKRNPLTWNELHNFLHTKARKMISPKAVWYCFGYTTEYRLLYILGAMFFHFIPGMILDAVLTSIGKKPRLTNVYCTAYKVNEVLSYFVCKDWLFDDDNTEELMKKMTKLDRTIYQFDVADLEFHDFMTSWCLGLRKYMIKDGLKGTELAMKRQRWLRMAHHVICVLYLLCLFYILRGFFEIVRLFSYVLTT